MIADEHAGLAAAVRRFLPEVRRQRCTVHLQRNVMAKVPHRLRKRVAREVAMVFKAPGLAEAKKRLGEIKARWIKELPEAMTVLERGFAAATQFYAFPEAHWPRLRTTNSLERLHAVRSSAASGPWAPSPTAPAPCVSSPLSLSGPPRPGATAATWTSLSSSPRRSPRQPRRKIPRSSLCFYTQIGT